MNIIFYFGKKTKDKVQSRLNLPIYYKCPKLHFTAGPKPDKPKATCALSLANKEKVLTCKGSQFFRWVRSELI